MYSNWFSDVKFYFWFRCYHTKLIFKVILTTLCVFYRSCLWKVLGGVLLHMWRGFNTGSAMHKFGADPCLPSASYGWEQCQPHSRDLEQSTDHRPISFVSPSPSRSLTRCVSRHQCPHISVHICEVWWHGFELGPHSQRAQSSQNCYLMIWMMYVSRSPLSTDPV